MTIDQAKRDLPPVLVTMPNGKTYTGRVSGRLRRFPLVSVPYDGVLHSASPQPWIDFETSWAQIARKATDGTPIMYC